MSIRPSVLIASVLVFACVAVAGARESVGQVTSTNSHALPGTYALVTIDGHPIPFAPTDAGRPANAPAPPEVVAATLVVRPDGSFIMAMAYRRTVSGVERFQATPFTGTTTPDGAGFLAHWDGAGTNKLTFAGDTLIMDNEGIRFAYRKLR